MLRKNSKSSSKEIFHYTFWEETIASGPTAVNAEQPDPIVKDNGNGAIWELTELVSGWKYDTNSSLLDTFEATSINFWLTLLTLFKTSSISTITKPKIMII
jgi:hypothetical protein